jgi:hypothetical protein
MQKVRNTLVLTIFMTSVGGARSVQADPYMVDVHGAQTTGRVARMPLLQPKSKFRLTYVLPLFFVGMQRLLFVSDQSTAIKVTYYRVGYRDAQVHGFIFS